MQRHKMCYLVFIKLNLILTVFAIRAPKNVQFVLPRLRVPNVIGSSELDK